MPPSPPQGTPRRPSGPRVNSSPPPSKLVPHRVADCPNRGAQTAGSSRKNTQLNLDAILSKLTPHEQAKYLRAKAEILEEKLGESVVEEGLTRSGQKMEKLICIKEKGQGGETDVSTGNSGAVQERT